MDLVEAIKLVIELARENICELEDNAHEHTKQHHACDLLEQHAVLISLGWVTTRGEE